jgi:endonuclease/exonuclease/phosphatase family metal-dependent hydrolase
MIKSTTTTIVCGDFNICYLTNKNNKISKYLEDNGFSQLMKEATHIKGRHLDHFYFRPSDNISETPSIYRYSPYYSDHDAICATIPLSKS